MFFLLLELCEILEASLFGVDSDFLGQDLGFVFPQAETFEKLVFLFFPELFVVACYFEVFLCCFLSDCNGDEIVVLGGIFF